MKDLKKTKLCSNVFLIIEMTFSPSNCHRIHSPNGSYSLFQFDESDVIFMLKKIQHSCVLLIVFITRD